MLSICKHNGYSPYLCTIYTQIYDTKILRCTSNFRHDVGRFVCQFQTKTTSLQDTYLATYIIVTGYLPILTVSNLQIILHVQNFTFIYGDCS